MPVGYTPHRSVQVPGFDDLCHLTPMRRLYPLPVRQASALPTASSRPHLAAGTVAAQLTLPLAGCVEDFHLQESAPCRAHRDTGRLPGSRPDQSHDHTPVLLLGNLNRCVATVRARFVVCGQSGPVDLRRRSLAAGQVKVGEVHLGKMHIRGRSGVGKLSTQRLVATRPAQLR